MEVKPKKLGPFDFLRSINGQSKGDLLAGVTADSGDGFVPPESPAKAYVPFLINRGLSYFRDTALIANEMNQYPDLPARMQYDFLRHLVRPAKRFSKWDKMPEDHPVVGYLMRRHAYSRTRAREAFSLLTVEQVAEYNQRLESVK